VRARLSGVRLLGLRAHQVYGVRQVVIEVLAPQ
jgi:hypothetical protein